MYHFPLEPYLRGEEGIWGEQAGAEEEGGGAENASLSALVSHGQGSTADQAHYKETFLPMSWLFALAIFINNSFGSFPTPHLN